MLQKILLIDDSPLDRFVAEQVINKKEFANELVSLRSAEEALKLLESYKIWELPELILLDLDMPGMNGYEFLEKFDKFGAALKEKCRIFLVTSSLHLKNQYAPGQYPYVGGCINKPFTFATLTTLNTYFSSAAKDGVLRNVYKRIKDRILMNVNAK